MARRGWFKLYRQIQEHWTWKKKPFSEGQAMVDLFIRTNWIDSQLLNPTRAEPIKVKKGEAICSVRGLSEAWGWCRTRTQTFLLRLQIEATIKATNEATHTRVKVLNWKKYQGSESEKGPQTGPQNRPHLGPRKSRKQGPSKNPEKVKETNPQTPEDASAREATIQTLYELTSVVETESTREAFQAFVAHLDAQSLHSDAITARLNHALNTRQELRLHNGLPYDAVIRYALEQTVKADVKADPVAYMNKVVQNAIERWRDGKSIG